MKLRSKFITSFIFLILTTAVILFVSINSYSDNLFKGYALDNLRIAAALSELSYFSFIRTLEDRTIDWSSDGYIRRMTQAILQAPDTKRAPFAAELSRYLKEDKVIYDPSVVLADIMDDGGMVIASSQYERVGADGRRGESERDKIRFDEAIGGGFGETFVTPMAFEKSERPKSMIYVAARIFAPIVAAPLDAVLALHFVDFNEVRGMTVGMLQVANLQTELAGAAATASRFALLLTVIVTIMMAVPIYGLAKQLTEWGGVFDIR